VPSKTSWAAFELADGGTLFLDEIGDVPLAMQAKLFARFAGKELERVGDNTPRRKVNVAYHRCGPIADLKKEVDGRPLPGGPFLSSERFSPIEVPPATPAPRTTSHRSWSTFLRQKLRGRMNRPAMRISQAALSQLTAHDWPGKRCAKLQKHY